ncbi:MFS transporter permease [Microbacterium sp. GXF7504]
MLIRRAYFASLIPAAFVLPLWLFVGWGLFDAGGWAFLWVLFIAIPSVLVGNLALALLVRARPTVRAERALSWPDVAGFGLWHVLTIAVGFYGRQWWALLFVLTVVVGLGVFWSTLVQLWREARPSSILQYTTAGTAYLPPQQERPRAAQGGPEVIVLSESPRPQD